MKGVEGGLMVDVGVKVYVATAETSFKNSWP